MNTVTQFRSLCRTLGPLRVAMAIMILLVIAATPWADGHVYTDDWRLLPSVVAPSIMMMLVFAIPLDLTMSWIFSIDGTAAERARQRIIRRTQIMLYLAMLAAWLPFILRVVDFWPLD